MDTNALLIHLNPQADNNAPADDDVAAAGAAIDAALACLDRFTAAFNACDAAGMDAQLHFPHVLLSGAGVLVWPTPGQHPADFFDALKATGWASTRYEAREPVLVSDGKVHLVVRYTRRAADGTVLSAHRNLWVIVNGGDGWRIALRSY